jgi:HNH endonuclease
VARFWICHWQNRYWRNDVNREYDPIWLAGSNSFRKRGVTIGDVVYIVSLSGGQLLLGGRMAVKRIVSRDEAVRIGDDDNLYDANEWIIGEKVSGTPLHLHRRLDPTMSRQLRFVSQRSGPKPLVFDSDSHLNVQTTRGVRELTPISAKVLDQILAITDHVPRSGQFITVTEELLRGEREQDSQHEVRPPEEVPSGTTYSEGSVQRILVNRYERDPGAREACLRHYGTNCFLCGFDFGAKYGELMAGFIHVHHLEPLSSVGADYEVDPIRDLRPVCPNCHAVVHRREPPYSLDEVRQFLQTSRGRC